MQICKFLISEYPVTKTTILLITMMLNLVVVGCVNKSARSAQDDYVEVYRYAYMALQEGKWITYKRLMRTVIDKSTASGAPPEKRAIYWYEYGRASGVVCDWEEAEFALTVANNLDAKTGGPAHESLNELGRINVVRKQYEKAVDYFTRGFKAFAQYHEKNPEKKIQNQLGNARIIEDFAYALEQTGGQPSDVKRLRDSAMEIRKQFNGENGVYEDVTPYGTQCNPR
jgi:tetratricopeptide (TPR) repeat protein